MRSFLADEGLVESNASFDLEDSGVVGSIERVQFDLSNYGTSPAVGFSVCISIIKRDVFSSDLMFESNFVIEVNLFSLLAIDTLQLPVDFLIKIIPGHSVHHRQ